MAEQVLGEFSCGAVLLADPEALAEWCEDRAAFAALNALAGEQVDEFDLAIEGHDAERAGVLFDRDWDPLHVHDATNKGEPELKRAFAALVAQHGLDARLVRMTDRITHPDRVAAALARGRGAGEISIAGLLGTVASAKSTVRLFAESMEAPEHAHRLRWMRVELGPDRPVATAELAGYITVESGEIALVDPATLTLLATWSTTWGDGSFPVLVERDAQGDPVRLRVDLGSEQRVALLTQKRTATCGHLATVSARVAVDGEPVLWLYRDPPDRPEDSGWRLFAGDEDDQFLDDPDNARQLSLAEVRAMDPSLARVLESSEGAAYERDGLDAIFREVTDRED